MSFKITGLLVVVAPWVGWGQSVAWNDPGPVAPNEPTQIELVFTDCQPAGPVNLPEISGLQVLGQPGRAQSFSLINFQASSSTTLSYAVRTTVEGKVEIPSLEVGTDKGKMKILGLTLNSTGVPANRRQRAQPNSGFFNPSFMPGAGQVPAAPTSPLPAGAAQAEASADPRNPYAGEIFDVNYRVFIIGNRSGRVKTTPLWDVQNFHAEAWDRGQQIGPGGSKGLQFHTRAMIPKEGPFTLPTIRQKLDIETGQTGRSLFFTSPTSQEVEVASEPIPLSVEPLPSGAPAGFKGAVGQFAMEAKMIPEQVNEGEPVTWTLTLRGTGNWPAGVELPSRKVPAQIRTIQPKLRREFNGTEIFTGAIVEDLVMIPVSAGEYELPTVKFVYFDPKKKAYETIEAKPPKIVVTKGASGLSISTPSPSSASQPAMPSGKGPMPASMGRPNPPLQYGAPGLPREPLEGKGVGFGPVAGGWLKLLSVLPWLGLLGIWWVWAKRRAVLTDPARSRKEAIEVWVQSLKNINNSTRKEQIIAPLLQWQESVACVLGLQEAVPTAKKVRNASTKEFSKNLLEEIADCYQTVEDALYGKETGVKIGDWCDKAGNIAKKIVLPRLKKWDPLRPRNLFPWLALIILLASGAEETQASNANTGRGLRKTPVTSIAKIQQKTTPEVVPAKKESLASKEINQEEKSSTTGEPDIANQNVIPVALPLAPDVVPSVNEIKIEEQKPNPQREDATPVNEEPQILKPKELFLVKDKIPEDPIRLYREGNFDGAAKIWHQTCRLHPMDPIVRNNLALAYFQLGDKDRALAYGLSAYLISPSALTVAWNTRIFVQSADQLDVSVTGLWNDRGVEWLTGRLGVFGWQTALILGMTIGVLGLGLVLASGYFSKNRAIFSRTGVATFLIGFFLLSGAFFTLSIYGKLADRGAVMIVDVEPLRSIPTEVEPQAEKAYPPGSIAHLEKSFLGWSKIRLPNHDMGWIRTEHIVPLY